MSAFMVSDNHIGAIIRWYVEQYSDHGRAYRAMDRDDAPAAMSLLAAENAKSVNARYPDHAPEVGTVFAEDVPLDLFPVLTAVEVIKACECLRYQSCETDTYETSRAAELTRQIESAAVCSLPGYAAARWAID